MNAERLLNMVIRQIMRRVVGRGINAGMNAVGGGQGKSGDKPVPGGAQGTKRARQMMRASKRLGRF